MITVYTTKTCAYCAMVKKFLTGRGREFATVDITDEPEIRQRLYRDTGAMTVPITESNGKYIVGWKPAELGKL